MDINPVYRVHPAPIDTAPRRNETPRELETIVAAVRALDKSGMLGDSREMRFVRDDASQTAVIQILDRKTGEVLEQIPPKQVLGMLADLTRQRKDQLGL